MGKRFRWCRAKRLYFDLTPGRACPQPEPNATELPSCTRISARAAQRRRRRRRWRGEEGERCPSPEAQVLHHVLWHVLRNALRRVLPVLVFYVSPKGGRGGGVASGSSCAAAYLFCPLKGFVRRVLYMLALHESTATVTGPAAPTKGFKSLKSAWRDDEETVDEETLGGVGVEGSWG